MQTNYQRENLAGALACEIFPANPQKAAEFSGAAGEFRCHKPASLTNPQRFVSDAG